MIRRLYLLHGCTIIFLATLALIAFTPSSRFLVSKEQPEGDAAQRNERSTPRSFILPATPAVTAEQENQAEDARQGVDVFRCLSALRALGYGADDTAPALRARNLKAVFQFQKDHALRRTGWFEPETIRTLKCQR